jgi:hypothetical protein
MVYNNLYERKYISRQMGIKEQSHNSSTPLDQGHLLILTRKRRPDNKYIDNQQVLNRIEEAPKKKKNFYTIFLESPQRYLPGGDWV